MGSMLTKRIFHVDLDAFFVAVERALDPTEGILPQREVVRGRYFEARLFDDSTQSSVRKVV